MVDNIKLFVTKEMKISEFTEYLRKIEKSSKIKIINSNIDNNSVIIRKLILYRDDYIHTENIKNLNHHFLRVDLIYYKNKSNLQVTINNSFRKWYFGKNSMNDFKKNKFLDCIELISNNLNLHMKDLLKAKITQIEIGLNIRLQPNFNNGFNCIAYHKSYKTPTCYNSSTVSFHNSYNKMIFYDKLNELKSRNTLSSRATGKIGKRYSFVRYELSFNKVSGDKFTKINLNSLKKLINNWDMCLIKLYNELKKTVFINYLTPKIAEDVINNITDVNSLNLFIAIKSLNPVKYFSLLRNIKPNNKTYELLKAKKMYDELNQNKGETYERIFIRAVKKRIEKISPEIQLL